MSAALILAMFFTVALIAVNAYFLMGSVPLLILKHDTPLDSRFVRGFYQAYFRAAIVVATATAVGYALAGRPLFAAGAAALAMLAALLRRVVIPRMALLQGRLQGNDTTAISGFRRMHVTAILANLAQLVLIVWSLVAISIRIK